MRTLGSVSSIEKNSELEFKQFVNFKRKACLVIKGGTYVPFFDDWVATITR